VCIRHLAEKTHLAAAPAIGNRHRVLGLRHIDSGCFVPAVFIGWIW
jgi:hypothetical protein